VILIPTLADVDPSQSVAFSFVRCKKLLPRDVESLVRVAVMYVTKGYGYLHGDEKKRERSYRGDEIHIQTQPTQRSR
jgi:hypothetical protein